LKIKSKSFALERFFATHEFSAKHLLSSSDCEAMSLPELLALADDESMQLWENLKFGYTETLGHPVLRESIAEIYQGVGRDNVLDDFMHRYSSYFRWNRPLGSSVCFPRICSD
jgi:hypothetical protein